MKLAVGVAFVGEVAGGSVVVADGCVVERVGDVNVVEGKVAEVNAVSDDRSIVRRSLASATETFVGATLRRLTLTGCGL